MSDTRNTPGDQLDWSRERDGRMADYATDDGAVETMPYDPEED